MGGAGQVSNMAQHRPYIASGDHADTMQCPKKSRPIGHSADQGLMACSGCIRSLTAVASFVRKAGLYNKSRFRSLRFGESSPSASLWGADELANNLNYTSQRVLTMLFYFISSVPDESKLIVVQFSKCSQLLFFALVRKGVNAYVDTVRRLTGRGRASALSYLYCSSGSMPTGYWRLWIRCI